jgi:hypothetical protein
LRGIGTTTRWDPGELDQMPWSPLGFTDIELIYTGMVERSARLINQASNAAPASPPR